MTPSFQKSNITTEDLPILQIAGLNVFYGEKQALNDINLTVYQKDYLVVIGPNGGGKTTLLKSILGLIPISSGTILYRDGHSSKYRPIISYVPSVTTFDRRFPINVESAILMGRIKPKIKPLFKYSKKDKEALENTLQKIGIVNLRHKQLQQLSSGEFQKVLIARALISDPEILLLDEPTANVDGVSKENIYNLLADISQKTAIILVTHDMFAVSSSTKRIACINKTLIYHGKPELTLNLVERLYGCPVDLIAHGVPHRVLEKHHD
jgi:zinc transport system ATP-binding protein